LRASDISTKRLTLSGLDAELGGVRVLRDVSLDIEPGEFVSLLGPSGSGKSTTLNVIAGFVHQTAGQVSLGGELIDDVPVHERDIGFVFQSYGLFPHMTVGDNIGFPLRVRKVAKPERRGAVQEILRLVQLDGMAERRVTSLSGGQQQRVALARALVFHPRVLLLDEPLAALDKQLRNAMQIELKRIQREIGVTTVAVTHDQTEALTMSDRVAVVNEGRIEQFGTPEELYQRPATLFVARFLGEANLLDVGPRGELPQLGLHVAAAGGVAVVRPEDIVVQHPGEEGVAACVEEVSFQGVRYRVVVRIEGAGGQRIVASMPIEDHASAPTLGARVAIASRRTDLHVVAGADVVPAHVGASPAA
jgi:putative spermidine/putrescine transport system ATP-binding protein